MTADFDALVAHRLPLAEATLRLLDFAFDAAFLRTVFDHHHGRSYEHDLAFPTFVQLILDALIGHRGSAHQSFQQADQNDRLPVSVQALYGKLRRVPLDLSLALFTHTAQRLQTVAPPAIAQPLPASVHGFQVVAFDGKKLKYVAKRLKAVRGLKGEVSGGKLLVAQDVATQLAIAAFAVPDGEAGDNPLVGPVVDQLRTQSDRPRLWIGDRAFCDFPLMHRLSDGADHFLIRYNSACKFHVDPGTPSRTGTDTRGRCYAEEWGWLGNGTNANRVRVRRITLALPGGESLSVVTSLEDAQAYPASDLLTVYRCRWGIETLFQQVVQTFDLRHLIGSTPSATVFQAMLCLLLYNSTLLIRACVAAAAPVTAAEVSLELLWGDVVRELTAWTNVLSVDETMAVLRDRPRLDGAGVWADLRARLSGVWQKRWTKAPTRRGAVPPKNRAYICGGHTSVEKILRGKHHEIPLGTAPNQPPPHETKRPQQDV